MLDIADESQVIILVRATNDESAMSDYIAIQLPEENLEEK